MKKRQILISSVVAIVLSMPLSSMAQPAPKPKFDAEKCSGVSQAGKNDCQTANSPFVEQAEGAPQCGGGQGACANKGQAGGEASELHDLPPPNDALEEFPDRRGGSAHIPGGGQRKGQ